MNLQQRIVGVIREHQPLRAAELEKWLPDIDHINLDVGINALMRANRVSRTAGYYDLVEHERPQQQKRPVAVAIASEPMVAVPDTPVTPPALVADPSPPSAEEEAAASLLPQPELFDCAKCGIPKPDNAFAHSHTGTRHTACLQCRGEKIRAGWGRRKQEQLVPQLAAQASELFECDHCHEPQPEGAYRHSTLGGRFKVCKRCDAEVRGFVSRKTPLTEAADVSPDTVVSALRARHELLTRQLEDVDDLIARLSVIVPEAFA